MLYLVATPIGNLKDFSERAVLTLKAADLILCEDTRTSLVLLRAFGIEGRTLAFHKFSERKEEDAVIAMLQEGKFVALISDAGMPGIADPGTRLVKRCIEEGITVSAIPGACSPVMALVLSGFETVPFAFFGFLPKKRGERLSFLKQILAKRATSIFFDTPNQVEETLDLLDELAPLRRLSISRELTKKFEETLRGTASFLKQHFALHPPRGEFTVVVEGGEPTFEGMEIEEIVAFLQEEGYSSKEAIKKAALLMKVPKKEVYKRCLS